MKLRISGDKVLIFSYFSGVILIGSFLLMIPSAWNGPTPLGFVDALFTSTSAVCVTGLTSVDTALFSRFGQIVILALIQLGGLGLIAFTTMLIMVPRQKISLVNRGIVRDFTLEEVDYDPKKIMRNIVAVTTIIELAGTIALSIAFWRRGVEDFIFAGLFHSVSAFCNAGFSVFSTNLEQFVGDPTINLAIAILIVVGGLGFVVCTDVAKRVLRRKKMLSFYSVTVILTTAALIAGGAIVFLACEWNGAYSEFGTGTKILAALFQSITPRTAGFDTVPQASLGPLAVIATISLMFIGGSSGSTAGGIKTSTFYILLKLAARGTDKNTGNLVIRGRAIPYDTVIKAVQIALKAGALVMLSAALLILAEADRVASGEINVIQMLFESFSAFGTVGLSMGLTMSLGTMAKSVLILTMFAGRVGLVAMALPAPGKKIEQLVDFATADHIVG